MNPKLKVTRVQVLERKDAQTNIPDAIIVIYFTGLGKRIRIFDISNLSDFQKYITKNRIASEAVARLNTVF